MRRASGLWIVCGLAPIFATVGPSTARDDQPIRIVSIAPGRNDSLLFFTLRTHGLPDPATRETLASGLPSVLVVAATLVDVLGDRQGDALSEVRIEPDLWTETFVVRTPLTEHRVRTMNEVASLLAELGPLPVARSESIRARDGLRIQARLAVYPLAPVEASRVHAIMGGEAESRRSDRQEVSVNISSLIRYFLKRGEDEEWVCEGVSQRFALDTLPANP